MPCSTRWRRSVSPISTCRSRQTEAGERSGRQSKPLVAEVRPDEEAARLAERRGQVGRETFEHPGRIKWLAAIVAAAQPDEVARVDVHREIRLGRKMLVVTSN